MRRLTVLVALIGVTAVGAFWWIGRHEGSSAPPSLIPGDAVDPITVEVLNGTHIDGLARTITRRLRRAGIDVVFYGSENAAVLDSTRVVVRRSDSAAAVWVRDLLGVGTVHVDRDETLLLDVSVFLGRDAALRLGRDP